MPECKYTYGNYGSYLNSRGTDKSICDIISRIEHGDISFGPIRPKGTCNIDIDATVVINPCTGIDPPGPGSGAISGGTGQLYVNGGYNGVGGEGALPKDLGTQAMTGINVSGYIIQETDTLQGRVYIPGERGNISQNYLHSSIINGDVNVEGNLYTKIMFCEGIYANNAIESAKSISASKLSSTMIDIYDINQSTFQKLTTNIGATMKWDATNNRVGIHTSDEQHRINIADMTIDYAEKIYNIIPVTYNYRDNGPASIGLTI